MDRRVSVRQILLYISMYIYAIPLSMKFRYLERTTALLLRLERKVCSVLMVYRKDFLRKHFCQIYCISGLWDFIFYKFKNKTKKKISRHNTGFCLRTLWGILYCTHFTPHPNVYSFLKIGTLEKFHIPVF